MDETLVGLTVQVFQPSLQPLATRGNERFENKCGTYQSVILSYPLELSAEAAVEDDRLAGRQLQYFGKWVERRHPVQCSAVVDSHD